MYRIYAIRYAHRDARRAEHFIGGDPHDAPMPMDYFVWAVVGAERSFVVDAGFSEAVAKRRKRQWLRCPAESLSLIGLDPAAVQDVILTHLHYDHVGSFDKFPRAISTCRKRRCTMPAAASCASRSCPTASSRMTSPAW